MFVIYTVEKCIGIYMKRYGRWRFNVINLILRWNVKDGCQNGGRKIIRDGKKDNRMDAVETSPILVYGYTDSLRICLYIFIVLS